MNCLCAMCSHNQEDTCIRAKAYAKKDEIVSEAVEAWREWGALPEKMFTDRLIDAMHSLSEALEK